MEQPTLSEYGLAADTPDVLDALLMTIGANRHAGVTAERTGPCTGIIHLDPELCDLPRLEAIILNALNIHHL